MEEKNFGYLGFSFQQSLLKAIIEDKKYGETIIDVPLSTELSIKCVAYSW